MRKKFLATILSLVLCGSLFAGCSLVEHNYEKDYRQVVAVIDPIEDTHNGVTYKSETRYIYKSDLASARNSYANSYMQNYNLTLEQAVDRLLDELVTRELLIVEAERMLAQGQIEWTRKQDNQKMRSIYGAIDSRLTQIRNEILSDYSESTYDPDEDEEEKKSTYPTPETEESDEDYTDYEFDERGNIVYETDASGAQILDKDGKPVPKLKVWEPEMSSYPCLWGDDDRKSLDREAMTRFIASLKDLVADDFKVTRADRAKFEEDDARIDDILNTKGIAAVYPMLGSTHYLEYLVGKSARESILLSLLQEQIVDGVTVTDEEVVKAYQDGLRSQVEKYTNDASAYGTDVSGGSTTVLYWYDDSYFFVKHILLPFSDAQKAEYEAIKADPKNKGKDFIAIRDGQIVDGTVVYPHVNGEDDKTRPMTVQQVYDEISAAMAKVAGHPKEAERLFDEFTYKYNTDDGAFGTGKQYAVKKNDKEGHSGYMEEFYEGAMDLYEHYKVGDMLDGWVVTDYGVHLMYFSQDVVPGYKRQLNDYLTNGAYKTVRDDFHDTIKTAKENEAFDAWQRERIAYYRDNEKIVHKYAKRYKNLY